MTENVKINKEVLMPTYIIGLLTLVFFYHMNNIDIFYIGVALAGVTAVLNGFALQMNSFPNMVNIQRMIQSTDTDTTAILFGIAAIIMSVIVQAGVLSIGFVVMLNDITVIREIVPIVIAISPLLATFLTLYFLKNRNWKILYSMQAISLIAFISLSNEVNKIEYMPS